MQNSIGLKFGHALANFAFASILSSSFTSFAFIKYRGDQIAFILDLCCFASTLCFVISYFYSFFLVAILNPFFLRQG